MYISSCTIRLEGNLKRVSRWVMSEGFLYSTGMGSVLALLSDRKRRG
jgi:hypothetical protein